MHDSDDLEQIRSRYSEDDVDETRVDRKKFSISLLSSLVFLVFVLAISLSFTNVGALSVGGVGGFIIEADSLIANNIILHPHPAESSACKANYSDPNAKVVSENEVALATLKADARQLRLPATSRFSLAKDIDTPNITGIDTLRIKFRRGKTVTNPNYPPTADTGPLSVGEQEDTLLFDTRFAGIEVQTGPNDGYSDLTFRRTRNVTDGESNTLRVTSQGYFDYSRQSVVEYPFTEGTDPNRYIDDVDTNGLSNTGTGDNRGYVDFTDRSTNNVTRGGSPTLSVNAVSSGAVYGEVNASKYPESNGTEGTRYFEEIDEVNITDGGTTYLQNVDDGPLTGGYSDFTSVTSDNLSKTFFPALTVDFERMTIGDANVFATTSSGDTHPCDGWYAGCDDGNDLWIEQVTFGDSYDNTSDDGYLDATDIDSTSAGEGRRNVMGAANLSEGAGSTLTISFWSGNQGDCEDECEPYRLAAWIDWDDSDSYESDEKVDFDPSNPDVSGTCDGGTEDAAPDDGGDTQDYPLRCSQGVTPNNDAIEEGSVSMRVILAYCEEPGVTGGTNTEDTSCGGDDSNWAGEMQDYTVAIKDPQWVSAWADWDQDGRLENDEVTKLAENVRSVDRSGNNVVRSVPLEVPDEAKAGKTLLRVVRSDDRPPVPRGQFEGETEDYTLHVNEQDMNSGVNAFVDWNQNGEFDRNELENEDFPFSSEPFGWDINGPVATVSDQTSSSPIYSVRIGTNSTSNQLVSTQSFDTSNAGGVYLRFWVGKGSDGLVNKPESGEDLVVEYRNEFGNWDQIDVIRSDSYDQDESTEKVYFLTASDALHTNFDVRFRGDGDGNDGGQYDNWYVDDVRISDTIEGQRIGTSTLTSGEFSVSNGLNVPNDAEPGSTLLRISHQQEGYPEGFTYPSPTEGERDHDGETEDYTIHVEPDESYVRAWVDWNDDGNFNDPNEGPYDLGSPVTFPDNNGRFKVSGSIDAPSTVGTGARLMRITHKQAPSVDQPPVPAEGDGGWRGETEDYTVIVGPEGDISQDGNLTIGDASLVISDLAAENINIQSAKIDEDFSDNTRENPVFGREGEFQIGGDTARLDGVTGLIHSASLRRLSLPTANLTLVYDPSNPRTANSNNCGPLPY